MPMHNWSPVDPGFYHDFHQSWSIRIKDALNAGLLPAGVSAVVEMRAAGWEPDVVSLAGRDWEPPTDGGGTLTSARPRARLVYRSEREQYAAKANRVVVRRGSQILAIIEIVSPGNKHSRVAVESFVSKSAEFISNGVHLLLVDPFPPGPRDPQGLHPLIWDAFSTESFEFPPDQDRLLAAYESGEERVAYIETIGVGEPLPDMPLFLRPSQHLLVPLEATYQSAWQSSPPLVRDAVPPLPTAAGGGGSR